MSERGGSEAPLHAVASSPTVARPADEARSQEYVIAAEHLGAMRERLKRTEDALAAAEARQLEAQARSSDGRGLAQANAAVPDPQHPIGEIATRLRALGALFDQGMLQHIAQLRSERERVRQLVESAHAVLESAERRRLAAAEESAHTTTASAAPPPTAAAPPLRHRVVGGGAPSEEEQAGMVMGGHRDNALPGENPHTPTQS